jgi:hypothetical protein
MKRHEKPLKYLSHATKRMSDRKISEQQVERAVRTPEREGAARREGARKLAKKFSKRRTLIVIIEEEKTFVRVISAYWN